MARAKKHKFKTEVSQLLDLMIHSLYSNREIFLRELISNASDALDKLRFASLSNEALQASSEALEIQIIPNKAAKTLTIIDNGIGMNEAEVVANIGTIANSGTKAFLAELKTEDARNSNLIGQFGVGFYASFMVADSVELTTRRADEAADQGVVWTSEGDGEFKTKACECEQAGTKIVLHIKEECEEFLDLFKVKGIVKRYSEHINFSVKLPVEEDKEELEAVNKADALWTQNPKAVEDEDYKAFYKVIASDWDEPLAWNHSHVEGTTEYTALLYFPKHAPFDLYERERQHGLKLYVKRVFIMEDTQHLLPNYLRFVRGVVDCPDLPLNVSREILQDNRLVKRIRSGLIKRVLDKLSNLSVNEPEAFKTFVDQFGTVLKEGIVEDPENKEKIAKLLQFNTLKDAEPVNLANYIEHMVEGQEKIYYLCSDSLSAAKSSPHLELFKDRDINVLLLTDKIDEWLVSHLTEFDGKQLQSVNQADLDLPGASKDEAENTDDDTVEIDHSELLAALEEALKGKIKKVQVSKHLRQYPSCVMSDSGEVSHHMQQLLKQMGQQMEDIQPILAINPEHALVQHMDNNRKDGDFEEWANILLDQALLAEGAALKDPGGFVSRMNALLSKLL